MVESVWSLAFDIFRTMEVEWQHMLWVHDKICDGKW